MATLKDIQTKVGVTADGIWGPKTAAAIAAAVSASGTSITSIQSAVGTSVDGKIGPKTLAAIAAKIGAPKEVAPAVLKDYQYLSKISQASIRSGTSIFGKAGDESNMVFVKAPYTIYYDGKPYPRGVKIHKNAAPSLEAIFKEVYEAYGPEKIHELHLDVYAGGYYYKKTTGGSSLSIHSWGCAIDWWPEQNALKTHAPKAGFSRPEYKKWWEIWEKHGWHSLGRERDYDWMHVQIGSL